MDKDNGKAMGSKKLEIQGIEYEWNLDKGLMCYDGRDSVLFWIQTEMKVLFDTIEEISGPEAAEVVLEATGFRQGISVFEYFKELNLSLQETVEALPKTYASAGWGKVLVHQLDEQNKTVVIQIKDSWEYKINKEQGKDTAGTFLPGHFAGLFTGVFGTNMGYRILKSQNSKDSFSEYAYFPSEKTISDNIQALARKKDLEEIHKLEGLVEERTKELKQLIVEISSPVIPVLDDIVVVPLLGKFDEERSGNLIEKTLISLPEHKPKYLILDLTGFSFHQELNHLTVDFIDKLEQGASLMGISTILVGISPEMAMMMSEQKMDLEKKQCFQNLKYGIYFALSQQGKNAF